MSGQVQRFVGTTDGLAFHEPVVIVYARELNALEARLSKMERRIELAQNAMVRAQPTAHELDGAIAIWEVAWNELREALAGGEGE